MFDFRNRWMLFVSIFFCSTRLVMAQYPIPDTVDPAKPFPWPEGKRCAISLTFDDARLSQVDTGVPLLNRYGVKATFYISPENLSKRVEEWKDVVADGHEIGNHTMTHPCTGNYAFSRKNALEEYTLDRISLEMDQANAYIFEKLQVKVVSFAYPCGQKFVGRMENVQSYAPVVAKRFQSGRGWLDESSNDPWFCDFPQLLGVESDGKTFEEIQKLIQSAAKENRWLILAGHEMGNAGSQTTLLSTIEKLCQFATDPANAIWIDTVSSVATYIQGVRAQSEKP